MNVSKCELGHVYKCRAQGFCTKQRATGVFCDRVTGVANHVYVSSAGIILLSEKSVKSNNTKYLGFTKSTNYPLKLNTGRVIYKATNKAKTTATTAKVATEKPLQVPKGIVTGGKKVGVEAAKLPPGNVQVGGKHKSTPTSFCRIGQLEKCKTEGCLWVNQFYGKPC